MVARGRLVTVRPRPVRLSVAVALGLLALAALWVHERSAPRRLVIHSGLLLAGLVLICAAYGVRRRLPLTRWTQLATWFSLHLWAGWLALAAYVVHAGVAWPTGRLEQALALVFAGVAGSGLVGLWLSRRLPGRLGLRGEELLGALIPGACEALRREAEACLEGDPAPRQVALYQDRLAALMARPRPRWGHVLGVGPTVAERRLLAEIDAVAGASPSGPAPASPLGRVVARKLDLDYQLSLQRALRGWLLIHVPLTGSLVLIGTLHGLLALALMGDVR